MGGSGRRPFTAELQMRGRLGSGAAVPAESGGAPAASGLDSAEVLRAIAELDAKLDRWMGGGSAPDGRAEAAKAELAALRHPLSPEDPFHVATEELRTVVSATEGATNTIMAAAEDVENAVRALRAQFADGGGEALDRAADSVVRIFEACNFQDLTGQRLQRVVRILAHVEARVEAMMALWDRREFEAMPLPPDLTPKDEGLDLHGPQQAGTGGHISQADIDALFD